MDHVYYDSFLNLEYLPECARLVLMDPTKLPGAYGSAYGPLMDPTELPGVSSSAQEDQEDLSIPRAAINKMIKGDRTLIKVTGH